MRHQATYTNRPAVHPLLGLGLVEFSHEPRLAGGAYGHYITSLFLTTDNYYTATDIEVQGTVRVEE